MFFTFDNKRPQETSDDPYVNDCRLRASELRQISEPGIYCHALPRQSSLIKDQHLFESGYVLTNARNQLSRQKPGGGGGGKSVGGRHTVNYHRTFSTPEKQTSRLDSLILSSSFK